MPRTNWLAPYSATPAAYPDGGGPGTLVPNQEPVQKGTYPIGGVAMAAGLTPDDLLMMVVVEEPAMVSPTGDILYVSRRPHPDGRRYENHLRRWSPTGWLLFD